MRQSVNRVEAVPAAGATGAYLVHWTSTDPEQLRPATPGTTAVMSATRVQSEAELIGFLLALPGDGTFVVRGVSEL